MTISEMLIADKIFCNTISANQVPPKDPYIFIGKIYLDGKTFKLNKPDGETIEIKDMSDLRACALDDLFKKA